MCYNTAAPLPSPNGEQTSSQYLAELNARVGMIDEERIETLNETPHMWRERVYPEWNYRPTDELTDEWTEEDEDNHDSPRLLLSHAYDVEDGMGALVIALACVGMALSLLGFALFYYFHATIVLMAQVGA